MISFLAAFLPHKLSSGIFGLSDHTVISKTTFTLNSLFAHYCHVVGVSSS